MVVTARGLAPGLQGLGDGVSRIPPARLANLGQDGRVDSHRRCGGCLEGFPMWSTASLRRAVGRRDIFDNHLESRLDVGRGQVPASVDCRGQSPHERRESRAGGPHHEQPTSCVSAVRRKTTIDSTSSSHEKKANCCSKTFRPVGLRQAHKQTQGGRQASDPLLSSSQLLKAAKSRPLPPVGALTLSSRLAKGASTRRESGSIARCPGSIFRIIFAHKFPTFRSSRVETVLALTGPSLSEV